LERNSRNLVPTGRSWHARVHQGWYGRTSRKKLEGAQVVSWEVVYAKQAMKDAKKLAASGLKPKAQELLVVLANDPFQNPPPFEKLVGDLAGAYSRRINIQHRIVYEVFAKEKKIRVLRMWTHYE
jgi:Txe/YoeB family toxin of toxin-antitoxin system